LLQLRARIGSLRESKETSGILDNLTLEVHDKEIKRKIENYLKNITTFVHKVLGILCILDTLRRSLIYLSDPVFYDNGYALLRGSYSSSYFFVWFALHYEGCQ
jgi:hypothetical protein